MKIELRPNLRRVSILYLFLPYFLFFAGWLKPWLSVPFLVVLAGAVGLSLRDSIVEERRSRRKADPRQVVFWLFCVATVLVWTRLSGLGGYGFQNDDYEKHNAILRELVVRPWPVYVERITSSAGAPLPLVYYIAHYLPAAAMGKMLGWQAANHFQFFWGALGVFLAMAWFLRLTRPGSFLIPAVFVFFSGLDVIGQLFHISTQYGFAHLEWWADICQYSSNTTLLFWVPQHALAGWIVTAMTLELWIGERDRSGDILFLTAGSALWSPFVTLGLAPFVLTALWRNSLRRFLTFRNLVAGPMVLATTALYLKANHGDVPHGWIGTIRHVDGWVGILSLFAVLEFGIYATLVYLLQKDDKEALALWWPTVVTLLLCPLYVVGNHHDLAMRASIPALFALAVLVGKTVTAREREPRWAWHALVVTLAIGGLTAGAELSRSLSMDTATIVPMERTRSLANLGEESMEHAIQYFGAPDSFFFRRLAR